MEYNDQKPAASATLLTSGNLFKQNRWWRRWAEGGIKSLLCLCAFLSVVTTFGIIWVLIAESLPFFREIPLGEFFLASEWTPMFEPARFGILPLLAGTLLVALGAALVAVPIGLGTAVFLSEFASDRLRGWLKPVLELLAGIPTIVYGYFALTFITPLMAGSVARLSTLFGLSEPLDVGVFNGGSAAIAVGIMILPMIASLSDDAMRSVPSALRHAAYAVGATRFEVASRIVLPGAFSGVMASIVLAVSRAMGETMVVALAAGSTPKLTLSPFESIQTMTGFMVQVSLGDTPTGTTVYYTLFAVGLLLFMMTLLMNLIAQWILGRLRERYD